MTEVITAIIAMIYNSLSTTENSIYNFEKKPDSGGKPAKENNKTAKQHDKNVFFLIRPENKFISSK